MARTNVGRGGGGGRGLSDHEAARGWGQISIQTNTSGTCSKTNATISADTGVQKSVQTSTSRTRYETNANTFGTRSKTNANTLGNRSETNAITSCTRYETNANISSNTGVQKSVQTNTSRTHYETNANTFGTRSETNANTSSTRSETIATISSDTRVLKSVRTNISRTRYETNANTSSSRSETNTGVQKSIRNNTSGTRSETNATMSSDTGVQEPVGEDELNTDASQRQRGSNIIEQVPQDPSKMKMICLDGGEFTDQRSFELFKWEGLRDVLVHDASENSIKKRYSDIMSKARNESVKLAKAAGTSTQTPPTAAELFELTHTKNEAFITSKSERVAASYNGALVKKYGSDPANHPIYDDDLWKKYAEDDMKGGVFGWGSVSDPQYTLTSTPSNTGASSSRSKDVQEEIKADLKEEMKNELKEEMREDLKEEIREELKEEMHAEIQDMLVDYGIKSCVTRQTKTKQDEEEENVTQPKIVKKAVRPSIVKKEFVKPRKQENTARKTVKKTKKKLMKDMLLLEGTPKKGKFGGKADKGFFVGYSLNSTAFRVFNSKTMIVKENLHIRFIETAPNVVGRQSNNFAGTKACDNGDQARKETEPVKDYILLPLWTADPPFSQDPKGYNDDGFEPLSDDEKKVMNSTVNAAGINEDNKLPFDLNMSALEDVGTFNFSNDDEDDDIVANMNNMDTTIQMDFKSAFLYVKIEEEVYVYQPLGFKDSDFPDSIQEKFGFTKVKNASTPMKTQKPLLKDEDREAVDVHMYRYQVNLKVSHLHDVKRIFRKPKRKNTQVPQPSGSTEHVADEAVYKELHDRLVMVPGAKKTRGIQLLKLEVNHEVQIVVEEVVEDINTAKLIVNAAQTSKPTAKGIVLQKPSESTTTTKTICSKQSLDKGKAIMIEEPVKPKEKDQIKLDEEAALELQVEFDEEEQRLARESA
nr:hypothetical protein [Tanacetum cinerariifolium]